jgi:hypothetical protein
MGEVRTMTGVITVVQESRFKLVDPQGRCKLFTLGHGAAIDPGDLPPLVRAGHPVTITFEATEGLISGTVSEISGSVRHQDSRAT